MNLLLTFDDKYTQHAGVTICSFLANNPGKHTIHAITDHISEDNQALLRNICAESGSTLAFYSIDAKLTKDFPIGEGTINPTLSIATYFRLFMTDVLPESIQKILYLDCDIIVDGSLEELWNTPFEDGKCIAALEELPLLAFDGCRRMGYPPCYSYFNAGVLLVHLERLRTVYSVEKASDFIKKHSANIRYHDQDVLNALLFDKKQFIPLRYNVMDTCLIRDALIPLRYKMQRIDIRHPKVIHYTGFFKPWDKESRNPFDYKYYEYLKLTSWKDYRPQSKFTSFVPKVVSRLKHWTKLLLDFLHIRKYRYISIPH